MTTAAQRLGRLLALVPYLMARPGAPVDEVAQTFGISETKLIDDLQLLFVCGLPGHLPDDLIEASFEGGVIHVANAETIAKPLRLGADEALALLVGLRTLAEVPGLVDVPTANESDGEPDALARTLAKLERAAGDAAELAAHVAVDVEAEDDVVPVVRRALEERRALHLGYYVPGRDETTERDVDPMRLLLVDGRAYLEGWCRRVQDVRLFRLDRVVSIRILDEPAAVPPKARSRNVRKGLFQPSPNDELVTLELARSGRWVAEYYPTESVEERGDGVLLVRLRTGDLQWVARLVLRLGGAARVLDPPELIEQVRAEAETALSAYAPPA
jgi:proteasome accessory factor C